MIDATDSDGEALAAIQGLDSVVGGLDGAVVVKALEIEVLQEDMDALKARLSDLLQR